MTRCVSVLFRSSPGLFWAWILISATQPKAAYILDSIPLEIPITSWFPADVDGDGMWELAVATGASVTQVGVLDPQMRGWRSGPFQLSVTADKWGAADIDDDDVVEYIYLRSDTVRMYDPSDESDSQLWIAPFIPDGACLFGYSPNAKSTIALLRGYHHYYENEEYYFPYSIQTSGDDYSYLHVYEAQSGGFVDSIRAGASLGKLENGVLDGSADVLTLYQHTYAWDDALMGRHDTFIDSVHVFTPDWECAAKYQYRTGSRWISGPPDFESMAHLASAPANGVDPGWLVFEMSEPQLQDGSTQILAARTNVNDIAWSNSCATPFYSPYRDFAIFDLDDNGSQECYMPLKDTTTWEVRELDTGHAIDTLENMPAVDLRTGPLLTAGVQNLFYFVGSTLYFYKPDSETGVFDDPETPQALADAVSLSAHPNPFNSAITLSWSGTASSLTIFNVLGQAVKEVALDGRTSASWDGCDSQSHDCPSGIYIAQVASRDFTASTKIVLLR